MAQRKKKSVFSPENTISHPDLAYLDNFVRNQPGLVDLRQRVQRSRYGYMDRCTGAFRDRFDALKLVEDVEKGAHPTVTMEDFKFLTDLINKRYAANHKFAALGVELSPNGKPMLEGNIPVDLKDGLGIKDAVAIARSKNYPIVSNNVYGQLELEQKLELSVADGIHQFATEARSRTFDSNPTGYYPTVKDESGIGFTYEEMPGVARTYNFVESTFELVMEELFIPPVEVIIGEELAEEYGIGVGKFRVDVNGFVKLRNLLPGESGQSDGEVRKSLEVFKQRDKVGRHAAMDDITGPASLKVDGIFMKLEARKGEAEVGFRNGKRYVTRGQVCNFNMTAAFELVKLVSGWVIYCLYVEKFRGNYISLRKDVQDYMRSRFTLKIEFNTKFSDEPSFVATSVFSTDGLPTDGIVIQRGYFHYFYKHNNTVDITRFLAERLQQLGIKVHRLEEMKEHLVYEFKTSNSERGAAIEPIDDEMTPRPAITKIMPNKLRNVLDALRSPTLADLKSAHEKDHPDRSCDICALF